MYLKRLELCGFKSFADKTRLDFEPGISGIIGPNGCGKSNISDSIRWCLGEQSARSMRSHQMLDVIFGGSQSRQTTGMAEVSLTFDNSQNVLPIDYSEVTVTRRLFRSGESEYFMNKVQCRLKDIRDLFLDTGIGTEGYAIIEQGKVEYILQAKPEQKREMFEEAAGVSKYKVRREETLRKLEKVDVDMNRVNDMLALLKEQINALDLAARKTRQYQKHKDDLRRLEVTSLVHSVNNCVKEMERLNASLEPRGKDFERINTSIDQLEAELAQVRLDQIQKDELYVKLQEELSHIKSGINLADERVRQAADREKEFLDRKAVLAAEISAGAERTAHLIDELSRLSVIISELTEHAGHREHEYRQKETQLQEIRSAIAALQVREQAARTRLFEITTEKTNLHNTKNRLASSQVHCQAQSASLQKEIAKIKEQLSPLEAEAAAKEQELGSLKQSLSVLTPRRVELQTQLTDLETRKNELAARQNSLSGELIAVESKCTMLKEWDAKDPVRSTIRTILSLNLPGVAGPVSGVLSIDPGMEDIVAAALGERLNYIVCDTADTADRAMHYLGENGLGRATFIVMDRLPESSSAAPLAQPVGARSLRSLIRVEDRFNPLMSFLCGETLINGQTIYGHAIVQGGGKIAFDQPMLVEEQVRHLNERAATIRREIDQIAGDSQALQDQLTSCAEQKKNTDAELQRLELNIDWMSMQVKTIRENCSYLVKNIGLNENDMAGLSAEEQNVVSQMTGIDAALASFDAEETSVRDEQQKTDADLTSRRNEEACLLPLLTEAKVAWATQSNELASRQREEEKLKETLASLTRQHEQYTQEHTSLDGRIAEQQHVQKSETENLQHLHAEQSSKDTEVQKSLAERQALMHTLENTTSSLHTLRQQSETLKTEIHDLQFELRSFELQKQGMEKRLAEDFTCAFADVRDEYSQLTYSDEEIARLKRRIESMGAVNMAAPEEYANLEERYNFLLTQQQDLLKAKEDLHAVILKINHSTKENFKKTFDLVRENFRNIYRQLFEGGEADLILTDESNLLETGVEIFAQPPGKKFQNIALLSGGEKAMTAIALLFAFFIVKPSPFCILDEVDAPLDDANIGRYINMIKAFAERSQFLIITHNKRTMEMADILYGVTMEELGVSKIISVRLNKENVAASA